MNPKRALPIWMPSLMLAERSSLPALPTPAVAPPPAFAPSTIPGFEQRFDGSLSRNLRGRPLMLDVSTFHQGDLNDEVIEVAAERLGSSITDVIVTVDAALYRSDEVGPVLSGLQYMSLEGRHFLLQGITDPYPEMVVMTKTLGRRLDFGIMRLWDGGILTGRERRQYQFFEAGQRSTIFAHAPREEGAPFKLQYMGIRHFIRAMADHLLTLPPHAAGALLVLGKIKGMTINLEAMARVQNGYLQHHPEAAVPQVEDAPYLLAKLWSALNEGQNSIRSSGMVSETFLESGRLLIEALDYGFDIEPPTNPGIRKGPV